MSGYSKEYILKSGLEMKPDFSFKQEFNRLKEGQSIPLIYESFDTGGIGKFGGEYLILMLDETVKELNELF